MLSNLNTINSLTDDYQNKILDEIIEIDKSVMKLREILKLLSEILNITVTHYGKSNKKTDRSGFYGRL